MNKKMVLWLVLSFLQRLIMFMLRIFCRWKGTGVALDPFGTGEKAKWHEKGLPRSADLQLLEKVFFKGNIGEQPEEIYLPNYTNEDKKIR